MNRILLPGVALLVASTIGCSHSRLAGILGGSSKDTPLVAQVAFEDDGTIETVASGPTETSPVPKLSTYLQQEPTEITEIRPIWSEAAMNRDGKPVVQGLMCKIYLFGPDSKRPQKGTGTAYFFGFKAESKAVKPDREWMFKPEELAANYHEDAIGGGYRFFLPWGDPSDTDVRCRVAVRFDTPEGKSVLSPFTMVTMPGVKQTRASGNVVQASHTVTESRQPKVELGGIVFDE